jgi:hypothetical protein
MPSGEVLLKSCLVACVAAVTTVLVLHAVGHGDSAVIAAGVAGGVAATTTTVGQRKSKSSADADTE